MSTSREYVMARPANVATTLLHNEPLLAGRDGARLRVLGRMIVRKSLGRTAKIIGAGDPPDSLYIIIDGRVKVLMSDEQGREVILSLLGPGEFFGEMGLLDDSPRSASVVTQEPCELLSISKTDFKRSLAENFDLSLTVMRGLVKRLREADRKIGSLALMDVYGRVARLLLEMAEDVDGEKVVVKKLSKQDIAKMVGASREMVSRVMKDLQLGGYFEVRGRSIVLRDNILLAE